MQLVNVSEKLGASLAAAQANAQLGQLLGDWNVGAQRFADFSRQRNVLIVKVSAGVELQFLS